MNAITRELHRAADALTPEEVSAAGKMQLLDGVIETLNGYYKVGDLFVTASIVTHLGLPRWPPN